VGTAVTEKPEENIAFIEIRRGRKQGAYQEGDEVEKVRVKKILRHNVIINTGKRDEVLTMEPEENSGKSPAPRETPRPQPFTSKQAPGRKAIRLNREEVEASVSDLNKLMKQVKVRPYMEGGEPAGFLVSDIKPGSIFTKMGIRNGDIIKGVNEETITSPDQAIELYQSLVEGGEIALQIKRGQRSRELRYEIQ
jgi:general secretion pathway protein C